MKRTLLAALTLPAVTPLFAPLMRGRATIFALHRFRDPDLGTPGHDPRQIRALLAFLRSRRYRVVGIEELCRSMAQGDPRANRAVAFTLDDGYADQAAIAGPVFAEFDCPVTVFVITGFLDGLLWPWWDRIEYAFRRTARPTLEIELGGTVRRYRRDDGRGYDVAQADVTERCKRLPEAEKEAAILRLAAAAEVALPERSPPRYAPMSWADVRACEQRGFSFGAHTVTHPVLARTTDDHSRREITESWTRLRQEARAPVPVFCYPSGGPEDYGEREQATVRHLGMLAAVTGAQAHVTARTFRREPGSRFAVPRFGYPDDLHAAIQYVCGLERLKEIVRPARPA